MLFIRRQEAAEDRLYHLAPAFAGKRFPRKVLSKGGSSGPSVRRAARGCVRARSANPGSLSESVRASVCAVCECMCARVCVYVCVRMGGGAGRPAPPRPRLRSGQAGIFPPSRMGDAESCLLRQQTREVRKKPLINYRFLRAAASAELRALAAAPLACQLRAPRTASPETQPRGEGAWSAEPAGRRPRRRAAPGQWNRAQPSAAPRPPQVPEGQGAGRAEPPPHPCAPASPDLPAECPRFRRPSRHRGRDGGSPAQTCWRGRYCFPSERA